VRWGKGRKSQVSSLFKAGRGKIKTNRAKRPFFVASSMHQAASLFFAIKYIK